MVTESKRKLLRLTLQSHDQFLVPASLLRAEL